MTNTAPKETPLGHLVYSAYDYVVSESLGFHVDYDQSLGQQYERFHGLHKDIPIIKQYQLDSLTEKCSTAITEMHRPIYKTQTAEKATIVATLNHQRIPLRPVFTRESYDYIREIYTDEFPVFIKGRISSYNSNTFKGRIYVSEEGRPVSFELISNIRNDKSVQLIVASLSENALKDYEGDWSIIYCLVFKNKSKAGHLKNYKIMEVFHEPPGTDF